MDAADSRSRAGRRRPAAGRDGARDRRAGARSVAGEVAPREAHANIRPVERWDANGNVYLVEADVGAVGVAPAEKVAGLVVTPVSVGNPHAVVLGDPAEIGRIGPLLETHPRFPQRTNVQVARVERPGSVTARVWERGVGETASSGTSAVAVAAATHDEGEVVVRFPGGPLRVRLSAGDAWLTGPARRLA